MYVLIYLQIFIMIVFVLVMWLLFLFLGARFLEQEVLQSLKIHAT